MNRCKWLHLTKGKNGNRFACIIKMRNNEEDLIAECSLDPKHENYVDPEDCVNGILKRRIAGIKPEAKQE